MRNYSDCHRAKITIHPINKERMCSTCGKIQGKKTPFRYTPTFKSEENAKDPFFEDMDKPVRDKPKRVLSEAQLYWIRKKEEQKKGELRNKLRKERNLELMKMIGTETKK